MQYFVIQGENKIFGTYHKTICFEKFYKEGNEDQIMIEAQACVFRYAVDQIKVSLSMVTDFSIKSSEDVFNLLDKKIAD